MRCQSSYPSRLGGCIAALPKLPREIPVRTHDVYSKRPLAEELDADMTATDLVETLERLQFKTTRRLISLDRDVRSWFVN
jgi:hypothetical protein